MKLGRKSTQACQQKFCSLYVRVSGDVGKSKLESLLGCEVLQYVRLISNPTPSYKVKIKEGNLDSALANGRSEGCFVARWCDKNCNPRASVAVQQGSPPVSDTRSLSNFMLTCWNCRGLSTSLPYCMP